MCPTQASHCSGHLFVKAFAALFACLTLALPGRAVVESLALTLDFVFSGDTPGGTPPLWLRLQDGPGPNTVRVTLDAGGLVGSEFAAKWYLNLNPAYDPASLGFSLVSNPTALGLGDIQTAANAFKADGDGHYDILVDFPPPPGSFPAKLTAGEAVVLDITRAGGLTLSDFLFESVMSSGNGVYLTAAHVQGIAGGGSAWVGAPALVQIPEPSTYALWFTVAVVAVGLFRRRARSLTAAPPAPNPGGR